MVTCQTEHACYHAVHNLSSPRAVANNVKIKISASSLHGLGKSSVPTSNIVIYSSAFFLVFLCFVYRTDNIYRLEVECSLFHSLQIYEYFPFVYIFCYFVSYNVEILNTFHIPSFLNSSVVAQSLAVLRCFIYAALILLKALFNVHVSLPYKGTVTAVTLKYF
jgi:hypothetical protein